MLKYSFPVLKDCFVKLFNLILKVGKAPVTWHKGLISPIHKKGDPSNPDSFWPICVLSCLCKFLTNLLNHRLASISEIEKLIHVTQIGFQKGYRTTDHIFSLKTLVDKHTIGKPRGKLYACFLDFKKAYDSVWHDGLFSQLEKLNIRGNFLAIIKDMYKNSHCPVKISSNVTSFFKCKKGVRQGCPLSPILFNIFIHTLAIDLDNSSTDSLDFPNGSCISCLMYANDVILISKSPEGLQNLLDSVSTFCNKFKMTVNPTKSKCILFTSKNKINKKDNFNIGEHYLENVSQFTYLDWK